MKLSLEIARVAVLTGDGADRILLHISAPSPFPAMKDEPVAEIQASRGYGETWCRNVLGVVPELIQTGRSK